MAAEYNTVAADDLAPGVPRLSVTMLLTMQDKGVLVFHEEGFQIPAPSQHWETIKNANMI